MSTQTSHILIDRTIERAWLDDLLRPDTPQRILLLEAKAGYGKSLLLSTYYALIAARSHERALIQLDRGGEDAVGVLAALCHQWGWERFPRFQQEVARLATPAAIEVRAGIQVGYNRSQINLPENPGQRKAQLHVLTSAWFQDAQSSLSTRLPAVIVVDSYNLADTPERRPTVDPDLHGWMEDVFLTQVQLTPALRLILAGQQTPAARLTPWEHCCRRCSLGPIHSLDDWQQYADQVGAKVTQEIISAFCYAEGGHPYTIAMKLMALRTWSFNL